MTLECILGWKKLNLIQHSFELALLKHICTYIMQRFCPPFPHLHAIGGTEVLKVLKWNLFSFKQPFPPTPLLRWTEIKLTEQKGTDMEHETWPDNTIPWSDPEAHTQDKMWNWEFPLCEDKLCVSSLRWKRTKSQDRKKELLHRTALFQKGLFFSGKWNLSLNRIMWKTKQPSGQTKMIPNLYCK